MNEKGQFSYALYFIIILIIFMPILFLGFPVLQTIAIGFLEATEPLQKINSDTIGKLDNPQLRADLNSANNAAIDSQATRINIMNDAILYGGIFLVIIMFIGVYMMAKRNVEVGSVG